MCKYWAVFQERLLTAQLTTLLNGNTNNNAGYGGVTYGLPSTCPEVRL
jgi:hypothetical protein